MQTMEISYPKVREIYESLSSETMRLEEEINVNDLKVISKNSNKFGTDIAVCKQSVISSIIPLCIYWIFLWHSKPESLRQINELNKLHIRTFLDDCWWNQYENLIIMKAHILSTI
ncbi:unnamed protein product [Blepharisma stoltei]|uniref:Uncharacterized protein n=1 Tax=Blepharisma stoltei TaxID=1481888 RepID=A0AAU9IH01_9CILI|nr:unnamed protein product [Blepharisma stoltei]